MKWYRLIYFFLLIPSLCFGGVIFQDDFDTWTDGDNNTTSVKVTGWGWNVTSDDSRTVGGITHHASEISSGGRTGNSFKCWRNGTSWVADEAERNAYWSVLSYALPFSTYRELYIRFYMKVPTDMDANAEYYYVKFSWPPQVDAGGPGIDFYSGAHVFDALWFLVSSIVPGDQGGGWTKLFDVQRDGQWHCYEYRLKLNSNTGVRDGIVQSWLDGVATGYTRTDLDYNASSSTYFVGGENNRMDVGFGNCAATLTTWQTGWRALEIDDYVVSTDYIGPIGSKTLTLGTGSQSITIGGGSQSLTW